MQIHDITKRPRRTDETLLDTLKAGIAGAKAVGQAAMSPTFGAVTRNQGDLDAAERSRQAINKKYGLDIQGAKRGASDLFAPPQATQATQTQAAVQQQVQAIVKTMEPEFNDLSAVLPDPGQVLVLKATKDGAKYYKTEAGKWFVQPAVGVVPKELDDDQIKYAEGQIEKDQYGQEPAPTVTTPTVTKEAAGISRAAVNAARKTAEQKLKASVAKVVTPLATKNKINAKNLLDGPEAAKAFQQISAISAMPASKIKTKKDKKQRIKQVFTQYATAALTGAQGEAQGAAAGNTAQAETPASQQQKALAAKTITQSGVADGAKLIQASETNPQLKQALSTITKESFEERLAQELHLLNEAQVRITKDITVRTAGGNYVKRASDQTWYDPNGVAIDPDKYADYVKRLDGTPQAQTQYQADANKGMTSSFQGTDKGFQAKQAARQAAAQAPAATAPAAAPDPVQQIADQQKMAAIMRSRDVAGLNAMINDTFNQLQNAKIFNTGQEPYLKDRMAQLMAMKV
jgi:hypothetical protein